MSGLTASWDLSNTPLAALRRKAEQKRSVLGNAEPQGLQPSHPGAHGMLCTVLHSLIFHHPEDTCNRPHAYRCESLRITGHTFHAEASDAEDPPACALTAAGGAFTATSQPIPSYFEPPQQQDDLSYQDMLSYDRCQEVRLWSGTLSARKPTELQ